MRKKVILIRPARILADRAYVSLQMPLNLAYLAAYLLDHGLDAPLLATNTGYFEVTLPGPGDNPERLRVPETRLRVTPAIEAQLDERQRRMVELLAEGRELTSRFCEEEFGVTRDTAVRDFNLLISLNLVTKKGRGRSTRYVLLDGP